MRRNHRFGRKRRRSPFWLWFFLLVILLGIVGWALTRFLPQFERVPPQITAPKRVFWSVDAPIKIMLSDNRGLSRYQALLTDGQHNIVVASNRFAIPVREAEVDLQIPRGAVEKIKHGHWQLLIQAYDTSLINTLLDTSAVASIAIAADTQPPQVTLLAKSPTIARGGSALVIFKAEDPNLKTTYIEAGGHRFVPQVYRHKPYYATLIAWPFRKQHLGARIVAVDRAGNTATLPLSFPVVYKKYKTSWIHASNRFINGRITEVAKQNTETVGIADPVARFRAVNETLRLNNEKKIHTWASPLSDQPIAHWKVHPFYPLKSAKLVADFGTERHYYYDDPKKEISHAWHLGYDLASVRHAPIVASNAGTVVFAGKNGIYGNMPLIDHGFGLTTLYGHCSKVLVKKGEKVHAGEVIARTGKTGLALGDHLHFGVLVHGIEVWPMDWMKGNWIIKNIDRVFHKADKAIGKQK